MKMLRAIAAAALIAAAASGHAADVPAGKPMKMDEPMPTKMKKEGMKQGDVKKAAEKKDLEMKPMLDKESAGGAKK